MSTTQEILIHAKALISDPAKWRKGTYSDFDRWHEYVHGIEGVELPETACMCGLAAVIKAYRDIDGVKVASDLDNSDVHSIMSVKLLTRGALLVSEEQGKTLGFSVFPWFNDHTTTTHADVMAAFDKAIELAEPVTLTI